MSFSLKLQLVSYGLLKCIFFHLLFLICLVLHFIIVFIFIAIVLLSLSSSNKFSLATIYIAVEGTAVHLLEYRAIV